MKYLFLILFGLSLPSTLAAQLHLSSGPLHISSGSVVYSAGDITNTGGEFTNQGQLHTDSHLANTGTATLAGDGQYSVAGHWTNTATFEAGTSTVTFIGDMNSEVTSGSAPFYRVQLNKNAADLLQLDDLAIIDTLHFLVPDNFVVVNTHRFDFLAAAGVAGYGSQAFLITNSTGQVYKANLGTTFFEYPVGFDANTYNPATLVQSVSGAPDTYGLRVLEQVLEDGLTGAAFTEDAVEASWLITEAVEGGSDLNLTAQWSSTDELAPFYRSDSGIARYDGTGWDGTEPGTPAMGTDPFTQQRSGITELGVFAIGGDALKGYVLLQPRLFLQGPYNGGLMGDDLRSLNLIPTTEPYGTGQGETIAAGVLDITGNDAIVDWILLELRAANDPTTIVATQAALLQRDGDVVGVDGISPPKFIGLAAADYFVVAKHRNHLGVRSSSSLALTKVAATYDFSTAMSQANGSNPMVDLGGSFGLWGGNAVTDDKVRYQGADNDSDAVKNAILGQAGNFFNILTFSYTAYDPTDVNLDGQVRYQGADNDQDVIKNNILAHPANFFNILTFTINQQL